MFKGVGCGMGVGINSAIAALLIDCGPTVDHKGS